MLKIRLSMGGVRKRPVYKIVVADSRFLRDGRFIGKLGSFLISFITERKKERVKIESDRVKYWLSQGAKPTLRVSRILGEASISPMPKPGNNPTKSIPKKERKKNLLKVKKEEAPKQEAKKGSTQTGSSKQEGST